MISPRPLFFNLFEEDRMNVLAFNGSPRMKKGVTDSLVQTFLDGAESAGA